MPQTELASGWGARMLWQSFNLTHTLVSIHTSLSDCCYRAGCTLSYRAPSCHRSVAAEKRTATHHTPVADARPIGLCVNTPPPTHPASTGHPHSPIPFSLSLFLHLTFPLMSCNTDNEPDDLPLIRLSLACLVIDP